ncbi:addiction module toxin RelE [Chromatium weissei]|nr:addiction module toxin RelE [Chromatium weissei]
MRLLVTPTFERAAKKLHALQKRDLDAAIRTIADDPDLGEAKVGDLAGIRIHKFRMTNQLCLLSYRVLNEDTLKLIMFGSHENFYRDLKRL